MVDKEKVEGLIRRLRQYTRYLEQIVAQERQAFLQDPKSVGSARYYLQISIETCISIANHVISTEKLRAPKDYKDSFKVLNEAGILPDDLTQVMRQMAGLRNLLVHIYWEVDDQIVYDSVHAELSDFETFIEHILASVQE